MTSKTSSQLPLARRSSLRARSACGVAVLAAVLAAGCQAGGLQPDPVNPAVNNEQRLREATDLAVRAKEAADSGRYEEAIELNRQALSLDANLAGAWNNLGVLLMQQQNYRDAIQVFARAADLMPADPRPYENLGLCLHDAGYSDEALGYYRKSLARDPNWLNSLRGAVACAQDINAADTELLSYIRTGLLIESDPHWRAVFGRARLRIEAELNRRNIEDVPPMY